jgi:abortive infection bacteriophage resistance protein
MKFTKPPLTLEQQADLLLSRGMVGDRHLMVSRLRVVNYYRLSAYWYPFRNPDDTLKPGTTFDDIWQRYVFDRRLRLLAMDAIERIEVALRTQLAYHHAHHHSTPFAYASDSTALPNLSADQRARFLEQIQEETQHSKETFVNHFRNKYGADHTYLPVWMACEIMTFGCLLTFYRGSHHTIQRAIGAVVGVHDVVLSSWLLALNTIRNICAHHGRLWNRELGVKPKLPEPRRNPQWHAPVVVGNDRIFGILTICKHCLDRIAPQSHWGDRVRELLEEFPKIPRLNMGIPNNWQACPIWTRRSADGHA